MNKTIPFTKNRLEGLHCGAKRTRYRDAKIDGLVIEVMPSGAKIFRVYKKIKGRASPVSVSLGRFPVVSIENARKQAIEALDSLASGVNPNEKRRAEINSEVTLQQVFDDYVKTKRLQPSTLRGYSAVMKTHLKAYAARPLKSLDEAFVKEQHAKISRTAPGQADLSFRFLRALFNFAKFEYRGLDNEVFFAYNPVHILSHLKMWNQLARRQTRLTQAQLPAFFRALRTVSASGDHFASTCCDLVEMALLTGLRRGELLSLEWAAVDRVNRSYYLSRTKNGDPLELPISAALSVLIERRYKLRLNDTYVFSAANAHGVVREPKKVINKIELISGVTFTMHDLRRTFTTIGESLNLGSYTLKRLLNHRVQRNDVTAGYTVLTPEELREPSQRIESRLLMLAGMGGRMDDARRRVLSIVASMEGVEQRKLLRQLMTLDAQQQAVGYSKN